MNQKLSKWYAVPPYKVGENWKILNDKGEIVAWFEMREDCEIAVEIYNVYVDVEEEFGDMDEEYEDDENEKKQYNG